MKTTTILTNIVQFYEMIDHSYKKISTVVNVPVHNITEII